MVATGFADGGIGGMWPLVARLVDADGSMAHRWAVSLAGAKATRRDLADAVHALCMLHGNYPGLADDARARGAQPAADDWLAHVADGFAAERAALAELTCASGPLPSTPGQADSENAILAQRHALAMLATSDRDGCSRGAVAALVLDWRGVRTVLDRAASAFGVELIPSILSTDGIDTALAALTDRPAVERAVGFGAQQLIAQQRGLWSLLEARAEARGAH